jgi:hypothetical protein
MDAIYSLAQSALIGILSISFSQYIWIFTMFTICMFLWNVQRGGKLDLTDMLTKNGTSVSLTKVLQLVGGMTATWVIMHMTMNNTLTESVLGLYLVYIGGVEGYSKFVAAKYKYDEKSVKEKAEAE